MFQIVISKAENGLWYDHDDKTYDKKGWGFVFKVKAKRFARPVPKFWKKGANPWKGDHWFVIRLPFIVLPFLSVALRNFGFYIGGKVFRADKGEPWARKSEYGKDLLTISATLRKTRWE